MKKALSLILFLFISNYASSQTTIISPTGNGGFESGATFALNGWTVVNGGTNQWVCNTGATAGFSGTRCAYITNNTAGTPPPHTYTVGTAGAVHMYRDVTFPSGETNITFGFSIRMTGETGWDRLLVYISNGAPGGAPVSGTPASAGTALAGYTLLSTQAAAAAWVARTVPISAAQAGNAAGASNRRILFVWQNDGSFGGQPPVAIDNINLVSSIPPVPNCAVISSPANGATGMCPGSVTLNWTAPVGGGAPTGYILYFGTDAGATNIVNGTNLGLVLTYNPGVLLSSTTYYWRILATNASGDAVGCIIWSFTTGAAPANDDPCSATALTVAASCSYTTYSNTCATATTAGSPPAPGCASYGGGDVWFSVVVPATGSLTIDSQTGVMTDAGMAIYSGTCGALTLIECDDDDSPNGFMSFISRTGLTPGSTIYIRFWEYGNDNNGTFGLCVYDACGSAPANDNCSGAIVLTMNTYGSCASTATGSLACSSGSIGVPIGSCFGNPDDDLWYSFVATSTAHPITLTTPVYFDAYMQLLSGPCGTLSSLQCSDNNTFTATGLTIGLTYYIRVYSYGLGAPTSGSDGFTLCIQAPPTCPSGLGTLGTDYFSVVLPYSSGATTTCGRVDNLTDINTPACGSTSYYTGEDVVYSFTPATTGQVTITLTSSGSWTGLMLYEGCPFNGLCVDNAQSASGNKSICAGLTAGITYYLIVDSYSLPSCNAYSLTISAPVGGTAYDAPCSPVALTLGTAVTGDNTCTGNSGEPAIPSCWTAGSANTVWYSFVAPASGIAYIQTTATSIAGTQIALYSGTCGPGLVLVSCNQFPPSGCTGATATGSIINATGLTGGATYYVRVDGRNSAVGSFSIIADNGTSGSSAPVPGQDCTIPLVVCNATMVIGNPGYANTGNVCDFDGTDDCTSGEKNSVWYQITIAATGNFNFSLMPNDGSNASCGFETDYDYLLWRMSGTGATTTCPGITAASSGALLACNFNPDGVTGIAPGGNAPAPYNACFDFAFEPTVAVTAGDVLYLCIQNYSGSTQGFTLDLTPSGAGVINYTAPSTVYWTGGASTVWTNPTNWGSCGTFPICGVSAVITAASATQPIITGTESVNNLTINPGATLTLAAGAVLNVCGSFTNNGTLTASPTSTIIFNNGAVAQSISGSLIGTNKFGHLTITKTGSSVTQNNDIDIAGNFTTSNSTSVFNSNNFYIKVAGNFVNATGNTTYTTTGTIGALEFNGTTAQTYNQGSSTLDLNAVIMNNSSTGVTLQTNMNIKPTTGTLTLTAGKINTTGAFMVVVNNSTTTSVSAGNTTSYVNGFLRRYINNSTGSFDFPVGTATAYQRANVNFTAAPTITYLTADFQTYGLLPAPLGSSECSATYNANALDNGFWNIDANTVNNNTGMYDMTLYNTAYTNAASGWTVMARHNGSATWDIVNGDGSAGSCVASPVTAVLRNNMIGFSRFGNAQSTTPLPIQLLSFTGENEGVKNKLKWSTASELNNDYFTLEHSADGVNFETVITKEGAGNSNVLINYDAYDYSPYIGKTYYRLKQTDYDGKFSYSSIIAIENKLDEISLTNVHPNPTTSDLNFDFSSPVRGIVKIQIVDYLGRTVVSKFQKVEEGKSSLMTQMGELAKGVYTLKVEFSEGDFKSITKVVKQ